MTNTKTEYRPQTAEIIAMAGKGGTGKTTITALLIRYLVKSGHTPLLAVDADANANLNELLGLKLDKTLGEIRDSMKTDTPAGMTKSDFMEMGVNHAIIEADGFDLIVMGQPEGPGCYCMANSILSQVMERLARGYRYLLVDNEAGMEHLSRLNLRQIHTLFVVSDPSSRGVLTARRIADLTKSLGVRVGRKVLIVNRTPRQMPKELEDQIEKTIKDTDLLFGGYVPFSQELFECESRQESLLKLNEEVEAVRQAGKIFKNCMD
ncbi:MAG: P-loop NTPase [Desulfobacteraceae bacterium]|nr:P-loop NTPase [Desulfobacteraceae bacterium]